jgi:hypothetical protein
MRCQVGKELSPPRSSLWRGLRGFSDLSALDCMRNITSRCLCRIQRVNAIVNLNDGWVLSGSGLHEGAVFAVNGSVETI